ncbi:DUF6233 domain-containing protein [Streptomyces showdoensis]|uniref:Uncharacterized protein n=1 Tax=Streptomyces showdoensis TaxID=68268 RepID=A0A2P2GKR6_STREW|nr:DUF6233 domain-containing protein [Streptomyces showdoensis]KKZ72113.1 hypothetical protein VO63_20275 [Streptomyces showdoensis]
MDIAERLEKNRAVLSWLEYQVQTTRETIRRLEREQAEEKRRQEVARRELRWKVEPSRAEHGQPTLHRGNCGQYERGGGLLDRDEVMVFAQQFPAAVLCSICAPWGSLGVDKPPTQAGQAAGAEGVEFP